MSQTNSPTQQQPSKKKKKSKNAKKKQKTEEQQETFDATFNKNQTFEALGVTEALCKTLELMKYHHPTHIQAQALPPALAGRDVIGLAKTGSGKTACFVIPIVQSLLRTPSRLYALVLTPTRELAFQISEQFEAIGSGIGLKCSVIVGGVTGMQQAIALTKKPHVVVGTPGRILDHLVNTKGFNLNSLKYLVLDEADRLLNMDFETAIDEILKHVPKDRNTYLYSATMTERVAKLERASLKDPVKIKSSSKYSTVDTLVQNYLFIPAKLKDCYLAYLLNEFAGNTVIIFTIKCATAQKVTFALRNLGFKAVPLHGKLTQTKRLAALNKFKSKERNILVATDVASRGLDIPDVDIVLNYEIPIHTKDYIHRVGRTARAGKGGRALSLVTQYDVEYYQKIEEYIGKKLDEFPTQEDIVMVLTERVSEAQRYAAQQMKEFGRSKKKRKLTSDVQDSEDNIKHLIKKVKTHRK